MPPKSRKANDPKIVELRERLGKTQAEMAEKLGVSLRMYVYYEAGRQLPRPVQILVDLIRSGKY